MSKPAFAHCCIVHQGCPTVVCIVVLSSRILSILQSALGCDQGYVLMYHLLHCPCVAFHRDVMWTPSGRAWQRLLLQDPQLSSGEEEEEEAGAVTDAAAGASHAVVAEPGCAPQTGPNGDAGSGAGAGARPSAEAPVGRAAAEEASDMAQVGSFVRLDPMQLDLQLTIDQHGSCSSWQCCIASLAVGPICPLKLQ